jgi:hypothetical protein
MTAVPGSSYVTNSTRSRFLKAVQFHTTKLGWQWPVALRLCPGDNDDLSTTNRHACSGPQPVAPGVNDFASTHREELPLPQELFTSEQISRSTAVYRVLAIKVQSGLVREL